MALVCRSSFPYLSTATTATATTATTVTIGQSAMRRQRCYTEWCAEKVRCLPTCCLKVPLVYRTVWTANGSAITTASTSKKRSTFLFLPFCL